MAAQPSQRMSWIQSRAGKSAGACTTGVRNQHNARACAPLTAVASDVQWKGVTVEGCKKSARGRARLCAAHGGGYRCTEEGCKSLARGNTSKCIAHGGGKRCTVEGCEKSARGNMGRCVAHGGGKRCTVEGCKKSAQGNTGKCKAHGGGKRCTVEGCEKSTKGNTGSTCVAHGGGKRCTVEGCEKSAQGNTGKCAAHGGRRCEHQRTRYACVECNGSRTCQGHAIAKCGRLGNPKYDLYCTHCFPHFCKDDPRVAQIQKKTHETRYVNEILTRIPLRGWLWDKPLYVDFSSGCCATKRRIDLRILIEHPSCGIFWVCIEIDEKQHKSYAVGYEEGRYNDLFMDFSGKYVFIRVNPDPYRRGGQIFKTPFQDRVTAVVNAISLVIMEGPTSDNLVEVQHLFYNE